MTITLPTAERFIIFCGKNIEPWVYHDRPFELTRSETIRMIVSGEPRDPFDTIVLIMGFELSTGKCRDATTEILNAARAEYDPDPEPVDHLQARFDRVRDLWKHEVA